MQRTLNKLLIFIGFFSSNCTKGDVNSKTGVSICNLVKLSVENNFGHFIAQYYLFGPPYKISLQKYGLRDLSFSVA